MEHDYRKRVMCAVTMRAGLCSVWLSRVKHLTCASFRAIVEMSDRLFCLVGCAACSLNALNVLNAFREHGCTSYQAKESVTHLKNCLKGGSLKVFVFSLA